MIVKKSVRKSLIIIFLMLIYCIPIVGVYYISICEKKQYQMNIDFDFTEKAYGEVYKAERTDIKEYYTAKGIIKSNDIKYINLNEANAEKNKLYINIGDEIFKNECIGSSGKKNIISKENGIVVDIGTSYIKIMSFDSLCIECMVEKNYLSIFENKIYDDEGNELEIISKSNIIDDEKVKIVIKINNNKYMYGEVIEKLNIYTGHIYKDVLTIEKNCVYKKTEDNNYYVRVVNEDSEFKEEVEVKIGYSCGEIICVSGIEDGTLCDSGYKTIIENSNYCIEENKDINSKEN